MYWNEEEEEPISLEEELIREQRDGVSQPKIKRKRKRVFPYKFYTFVSIEFT